jgi:hypothetical protein
MQPKINLEKKDRGPKIGEYLCITLMTDDFYGDPQCGLIDQDNMWALVGGEHLAIWTPTRFQRIEHDDFCWILEMRLNEQGYVECMANPPHKESGLWLVDVKTFEFRKII